MTIANEISPTFEHKLSRGADSSLGEETVCLFAFFLFVLSLLLFLFVSEHRSIRRSEDL